MIKDAGSKYDDYSILAKIRQILLHWDYELTGKDFFLLTRQINAWKRATIKSTEKKSCKKQEKIF